MPRPMNETMLDVIVAVQAKKKLVIAEGHLHRTKRDWYKESEQYFLAIPVETVQRAGLKRNRADFERIAYGIELGEDVLTTNFDELGKFDFDTYRKPEFA